MRKGASVERYGAPAFEVSHCGGVPISYSVKHGSQEQRALLALNEQLLKSFGFEEGVTHAEFIRPADLAQRESDQFIFLKSQHVSVVRIRRTLSKGRLVLIYRVKDFE